MNCNEARQHWNLYHDSEGDAVLHFRVGEHLAACPGCAEWFAQQSRLERLLAEKLDSPPPTREVWDQVLAGAGLRKSARSRRWFLTVGVTACAAALVLAVIWSGPFFRPAAAPDLAKLTADWHQRLAEGEQPLEYQAHSDQPDLEVEDYLRQRVSFPVRCPPRKDVGFAVRGAGVCRLGGQPAAYLAGQVDEAPVSIFILPREGLTAFPHQQEAVRREQTHRCREGPYAMVLGVKDKNAVLVIGQAAPDRLEKVLSAYGTYSDHH